MFALSLPHLKMTVSPVIQGPPFTQHSVTEEEHVILECEVSGIPTPIIRWIHGSQEITGNGFHYNILPSGSLEIPVVRREDQGVYVCFADNGVGIAQVQRSLEVKGETMTAKHLACSRSSLLHFAITKMKRKMERMVLL